MADEIPNKLNKIKNVAERQLQCRIILPFERENLLLPFLCTVPYFPGVSLLSTINRFQNCGQLEGIILRAETNRQIAL